MRKNRNRPESDEPLSEGRVEYLDDAGAVIDHSDSQTAEVAYRAHCASLGIAPDERIIGSQ